MCFRKDLIQWIPGISKIFTIPINKNTKTDLFFYCVWSFLMFTWSKNCIPILLCVLQQKFSYIQHLRKWKEEEMNVGLIFNCMYLLKENGIKKNTWIISMFENKIIIISYIILSLKAFILSNQNICPFQELTFNHKKQPNFFRSS